MSCEHYDARTDHCISGDNCHDPDRPESCRIMRVELGLSAEEAAEHNILQLPLPDTGFQGDA